MLEFALLLALALSALLAACSGTSTTRLQLHTDGVGIAFLLWGSCHTGPTTRPRREIRFRNGREADNLA